MDVSIRGFFNLVNGTRRTMGNGNFIVNCCRLALEKIRGPISKDGEVDRPISNHATENGYSYRENDQSTVGNDPTIKVVRLRSIEDGDRHLVEALEEFEQQNRILERMLNK